MAAGDPSSDELRIAALEAELTAMRGTLSWRVTRPLRAVRRRTRSEAIGGPVPDATNDRRHTGLTDLQRAGMAQRVGQLRTLFATDDGTQVPGERIADLLTDLERAGLSDGEAAWIALVAATGRYPLPAALAAARRVVRRAGIGALTGVVERAFESAVAEGVVLPAVEIVRDRVLVDITQTTSQDLHSGIQRVARECAARWLARSDTELVHFDDTVGSVVRLSPTEHDRAVNWQDHLHVSGAHISRREPEPATGATVIPWRCLHVIPEYVESETRVDAYVAARDAGVTSGVSMVAYDLIPITASELTYPGSTQSFGRYLSLVKHAGVISAISASTGRELRSFLDGVRDQGLVPPHVVVHSLPSGRLDVTADELEATRQEFGVTDVPLVLAVGSHEPRKNHVMIVEAAERLWRTGRSFELLLVGAFAWETAELDAEVQRLSDLGYRVRTVQRVDERSLWALYRLASFTVFVSLVEGFGLPVAESLRCGTPVVTSGYGSMAEIAAGGGAVQVDPRDVGSIAGAMGRLLDDPAALESLRGAASARSWPEWSDYADAVWADLVTAAWQHDTLSGGERSALRN